MYEVVIIGGGPGGYVAALESARKGLKTALVEEKKVGGVCLNVGCIPTKAMLYCSSLLTSAAGGKRYGLTAENISFDENAADRHRSLTVSKLVKGIENLLAKRGVDIIRDTAVSVSKGKTVCKNIVLESRNIIIATGSRPADIPPARFDGENIISSDQAVTEQRSPESILVVGAGVIGVEMATYWSSIGKRVVLVEMLGSILPLLKDDRVSAVIAESLKKKKAAIFTGKSLEKCEIQGQMVKSFLSGGDIVETEKVLIATGRKPDSSIADPLVLKRDSRGHILTDELCRTNVDGIWAIGDVAGEPYLAHKASHEAEVAVSAILGEKTEKNLDAVPSCVFSDPEVATVGLNPREAEERGITCLWGEFPFSANGKAVSSGMIEGFARIVARKEDHAVIGGQIAGASADLLIGEISLAVRLGLGLEDLARTVHVHPSLCEVIPEAARVALGEPLHR